MTSNPQDEDPSTRLHEREAWWVRELVGNRQRYLRHIQRRIPSTLSMDAHDIFSAVYEALSKSFSHWTVRYPASWFQTHPPPARGDVDVFHRYVYAAISRQISNTLRADYRRVMHEKLSAATEPPVTGDMESHLDARRLILAVQDLLDMMEVEDRELLLRTREERPLTTVERKRLSRLRSRLRERLLADLIKKKGKK